MKVENGRFITIRSGWRAFLPDINYANDFGYIFFTLKLSGVSLYQI